MVCCAYLSQAIALGVLALGISLYVANYQSEGVVAAAERDVTSSPGAQYTAVFMQYDGTEVDVIQVWRNWVRLALPSGDMEGWVPAGAAETANG